MYRKIGLISLSLLLLLDLLFLLGLLSSDRSSLLVSPIIGRVASETLKNESQILDIPLLAQERNLSCEAATIRMILSFYGRNIAEDEVLKTFPIDPNPKKGFRGNVDGRVWGFNDYGANPEVVSQVLATFGVPSTYGYNLTEESLKKHLLKGKPAIIWVSITNPNPKVKEIKIGDDLVELVAGEHTVVVKGYKDGFFYINDPWFKTLEDQRVPDTLVVSSLESLRWGLLNNGAVLID